MPRYYCDYCDTYLTHDSIKDIIYHGECDQRIVHLMRREALCMHRETCLTELLRCVSLLKPSFNLSRIFAPSKPPMEFDFDEDAPLALYYKDSKRNTERARNMKQPQAQPEESAPTPQPAQSDDQTTVNAPPKILISEFDDSVENHFKAVDTIAQLCGYAKALDDTEVDIKRLSNSIIFLRHWRDFNYKPRIVRFACQHNSEEKDVIGEVILPQFSAAAVPEKEVRNVSEGVEHIKDFVMNVGGAVWALDWCPRVDQNPDNCIKSEFVAIGVHPPDSSYHEIGASLTGRGVIQIWCLLTICVKNVSSQVKTKSRPNTKKKEIVKSKELILVTRSRKKPLSVDKIDNDNQYVRPLATSYRMSSPRLNSSEGTSEFASKPKDSVRTLTSCRVYKRKARQENQFNNNTLQIVRHCQQGVSPLQDPLTLSNCSLDSTEPHKDIPVDVALPRMMYCLAHNGKAMWDVKWRPVSACFPRSRNIMGYLAVLLGSGAMEVWEVPFPHAVKLVYPRLQEHIDPRFIKLQPVFRCSMLKCGDKRSIPMTVEWSVSSPHDMILAGCHDGVVAIWKFFVSDSLTESRPLVYINADTGPIRTLAWAPTQSDLENANIIITTGSKGFKFWDIRDPFRPLWVHPFQGITYGLDWLPDPRCVFGAMEDGTLWLVSLERATHDIPVTGKCHNVASKHGFHSFHCSPFAIWCLQASRLTGTVAYCGEEGSTFCFKPTARLLKDPSRNRVPHYLCGSILEEEAAIVVASPLPNSLFHVKSPDMKRTQVKEHEKKRDGLEALPPKMVAMHKVRWNVNKGGEKWLCYGGAAGLVRCQELHFSTSN